MRDLFAVLGEPRQPWLDLDELQERYHRLGLTNHPDVKTLDAPGEFASITEAYRVLSDPKLRLQHLLQLEGNDPAQNAAVPESLLELFSRTSDFLTRAAKFWSRREEATNALSKSLLQAEIRAIQRELDQLIADTTALFRQAERTTRALNPSWRAHLAELGEIYRLVGFVTRWLAQLYEWKFRLDNA
jgi:curved DNA-binding protein CbpA